MKVITIEDISITIFGASRGQTVLVSQDNAQRFQPLRVTATRWIATDIHAAQTIYRYMNRTSYPQAHSKTGIASMTWQRFRKHTGYTLPDYVTHDEAADLTVCHFGKGSNRISLVTPYIKGTDNITIHRPNQIPYTAIVTLNETASRNLGAYLARLPGNSQRAGELAEVFRTPEDNRGLGVKTIQMLRRYYR